METSFRVLRIKLLILQVFRKHVQCGVLINYVEIGRIRAFDFQTGTEGYLDFESWLIYSSTQLEEVDESSSGCKKSSRL